MCCQSTSGRKSEVSSDWALSASHGMQGCSSQSKVPLQLKHTFTVFILSDKKSHWIVCYRSWVKLASLFVKKQPEFAVLLLEYTPKLESFLYELLSLNVLKKLHNQLLKMATVLLLSSIMWTWTALNNNLMEPDGVELAYIQHDWCSNDFIFKMICHHNKWKVMITHSWPKNKGFFKGKTGSTQLKDFAFFSSSTFKTTIFYQVLGFTLSHPCPSETRRSG